MILFSLEKYQSYHFNEHRQLFFELFWDSGQFLVEFEVKILNIWRKKPIDRNNVIEFLISFELKKNSHMKYCSVKKTLRQFEWWMMDRRKNRYHRMTAKNDSIKFWFNNSIKENVDWYLHFV